MVKALPGREDLVKRWIHREKNKQVYTHEKRATRVRHFFVIYI